jgi:hypothetical protein
MHAPTVAKRVLPVVLAWRAEKGLHIYPGVGEHTCSLLQLAKGSSLLGDPEDKNLAL